MSELRNYLSNAYYSHTCSGHEALGSKWYSQFTSPLRKYMDVVVHRLLNKEYVEDLHYLCQYSSAIERLLKIKVDSSMSSYFLDKLQYFVSGEHELTVRLLKLNSRHLILSTDQDFFLFVLLPADSGITSVNSNILDQFLTVLKANSESKIKIFKVLKDKKDINIIFSPSNEIKSSGVSKFIKAKILFFE